ncbi:hypothetical protein S7711_04022 [Stachybotrys chartarum IBT 7711]|uniref:UBZ4-type domain-containing protein n=1 Tax=Stachybotrys chartarum (strain CBS 109288 / IBT 7711) TaxID=1280523 RepID=A0A084AXH7_STACB|nr:hypothetical protein S7711_04022 [Stachybotrys chartarum IBT 7711]KFA50744.1 hypothetical protein S40293_06103 [Stachybotrys chartarum IBT 40293]
MNRPRNRQSHAPRGGRRHDRGPSRASATPQQAAGTVPTIQQVIQGASVFIVLKEDQPTGQETAGVVQDILTRGNHPRGIKVRLRGGQVGRVQRLGEGTAASPAVPSAGGLSRGNPSVFGRNTDVRYDSEFPAEPPPRSLADFMPSLNEDTQALPADAGAADFSKTTIKCPFCSAFEGDEVAVTHHIEQNHLG